MNETVNTNNHETEKESYIEFMHNILKKSFDNSVNTAAKMMDVAYQTISKNTDNFKDRNKEQTFKAGFESAIALVTNANNSLLKDVIKLMEDDEKEKDKKEDNSKP